MIFFEYAERDVSVEHVEVGAEKNVTVDDVALSGKEKSLLLTFKKKL